MFINEFDFEEALVNMLFHKGWSHNVLRFKTEQELIDNWANILFQNNNSIDRLNGAPLTKSEMSQILDKIKILRTPHKIHSFINGKTILITRDNPSDKLHYGKDISLKIYDREEIAGGQSTYQIAEQPVFAKKNPLSRDRRGDFVLLINGMPVIHVELKKDGIPLSQAVNQIEKYSHEGIFTGLFSLVQIFVAMTPTETVYFANPGPDGHFKKEFQFHWADINNERKDKWEEIAEHLLSIPMAHQMIGFYTVADDSDQTLKVLRSYQYNAAFKISAKVSQTVWDNLDNRGGYIWHTTGSGKTLTSFKSAQLVANSKDADKVIFLIDRIELGTQSLDDYRGFADDSETVQGTESSSILLGKLKSNNVDDTLIVTSIQKLSILSDKGAIGDSDFHKIEKKRIVIIVDECHRSTFGDMMNLIKMKFKNALFFGFSGTPIQDENAKKGCTTAEVFGNELHRYTIADGIRDGNVLGFDPCLVPTFKDRDLRKAVALSKSHASTEEEALSNPNKKATYLFFMNQLRMSDYVENGNLVLGIESYIPETQYTEGTQKHKKAVVEDIIDNWISLSQNHTFHALLATPSINEAVEYYRLFKVYLSKENSPRINVTAVFDPNFDNNEGNIYKEDGLLEILDDYNKTFNKVFSASTAGAFKKDVCLRLAHKEPYQGLENDKEHVVDLVIVVDQLLTGFDSKWLNTLYIDKMMKNEQIIQAFSRTNRLYGQLEKPHGIIKMYRRPHTMEDRMFKALKLYSGDRPYGVFVSKLEDNLILLNTMFSSIQHLFVANTINDFEKLPDSEIDKAKFAKDFKAFSYKVATAKIQGLVWAKEIYEFNHNGAVTSHKLLFGEEEFLALLQRYKELIPSTPGILTPPETPPFDVESDIVSIPTDLVDAKFMESRFEKFLIELKKGDQAATEDALNELHKTFSTLNQEEQKYANIIINDIHNGSLIVEEGKTIRDYISEYISRVKNDQIHKLADFIGVDETSLRSFLADADKNDLDSFGRLTSFKKLIDKQHLRLKMKEKYDGEISIPEVNIKLDKLLRNFVGLGGFDIDSFK